jgi:hypothetical protein
MATAAIDMVGEGSSPSAKLWMPVRFIDGLEWLLTDLLRK